MTTIESKGQFFTKGIDSHDESIHIANWNAVVSRVGSYTLVTLNVQQIRSQLQFSAAQFYYRYKKWSFVY